MYIKRNIDIFERLKKKSHFLFGPRQTGKTQLIINQLPQDQIYLVDLLDNNTYLRLATKPSRLREEIPPGCKYVVIDEIQKLPTLLDEVQLLIEKKGIHFLLTGSSARKLKRSGVNLLGGRARSKSLHPFSWVELRDNPYQEFQLLKALNWGLIPSIFFSDEPTEDLSAYVNNYLQLEIMAEGLTRNLPAFSRFLVVAATCNGQIINYSSVSNDAQVALTTTREYFSILKDTLIGSELPVWKSTVKRKAIATPKFYFFDYGVVRYLQQKSPIKERSPDYGDAFEAFIYHELKTFVDYHSGGSLCYWRSKSRQEVDFILNDVIAIEVKGKALVANKDLRGIKALKEENILQAYYVVCLEAPTRYIDDIVIMSWDVFLEKLWTHKLI